MSRAEALPNVIANRPFSVAEALTTGVSPSRLRAADVERSVWGVRSRQRTATLIDVCRLMTARVPGHAFFSHTTAALLYGVPLPWRFERDPRPHVSVAMPHHALHSAGLHGHRMTTAPADITTREDLRLSAPARTWCDLGGLLQLEDLVAAADFLVHRRHPLVTIAALEEAVDSYPSRRGLRRLRATLPMVSDSAESRPESKLRVILVQAGFTRLLINRVVTDRFGEFVARTDVELIGYNVVIEYQGDDHRRTAGQWRADMSRRSRLESTGKRVMEINADDLRKPAELIARIWALIRVGS